MRLSPRFLLAHDSARSIAVGQTCLLKGFDIVPNTSILWRRLDQPGHESALLSESAASAVIEGTAVFSESGQPCRLDYRVVCDAAWRTVSARVTGWLDSTPIDVAIGADATRTWTLNGQPCPALQGCDDIDLSFSPATNLLPIRRTRMAVGARVSLCAAWLRFPALTLESLDQTYERVSESRYRYESGGGSFVVMLETNAVGFVTHYPGLWELEEGSDRDG
jgi:uncharacterized protein